MQKALTTLFIFARKSINVILYFFDSIVLRKRNNFVILCYHSFDNDSWRFSTKKSSLSAHISYLKDKGYTFISLADVKNALTKKDNGPYVLVTIDDGYKDALSVQKLFIKENIKPTLFVMSNTQVNRKELANNKKLLSVREMQTLSKSGWDIGSHSATHADLSSLSQDQLQVEVVTSKSVLEKKLRKKITAFAYPKGRYTDDTVKMLKKAGYSFGFTLDDYLMTKEHDFARIPRIGVDNSHGVFEFRTIFSPTVIWFRHTVKRTALGAYL